MTGAWLLQTAAIAAILLAGLMAGLFWSFSVAVMPGLARAPVSDAMAAMQGINRAILNPIFFVAFFGAAAISLFWAGWFLVTWDRASLWLGIAGLVYLAAVFAVTIFVNVPMNRALDGLDATDPAHAAQMAAFIRDWTLWNHVRTVGSGVAFVLFLVGLSR